MKGSQLIFISVFLVPQLSNALSRSRHKQTDVSSDEALLHYVAECPVNYVIELSPVTTGRTHALLECENILWKVVYEHCQGQQNCLVSLPWTDMLKNKVECLNEIENYRPFHYQCRRFSDSGHGKSEKGMGLVSALYEMARKAIGHSGEVDERQGDSHSGPKTAKASSSRRVSMSSHRRTPSGHSRSSMRMSSSRRVSASWNSWNGPMDHSWNSWSGGNAIHGSPQPWTSWNARNGWSQTMAGFPILGQNQPRHPANTFDPLHMLRQATPAHIRDITPPGGSHWAEWNNARGLENQAPERTRLGEGGRPWTSWSGLNDWSSWAARFSSGIDFVGTTPVSLIDILFGRRGYGDNVRVYDISHTKDYPIDNATVLERGTSSKDSNDFKRAFDFLRSVADTKSSTSSDENDQDLSSESNAFSASPEPEILFDSSGLEAFSSGERSNASAIVTPEVWLQNTSFAEGNGTYDAKVNDSMVNDANVEESITTSRSPTDTSETIQNSTVSSTTALSKSKPKREDKIQGNSTKSAPEKTTSLRGVTTTLPTPKIKVATTASKAFSKSIQLGDETSGKKNE